MYLTNDRAALKTKFLLLYPLGITKRQKYPPMNPLQVWLLRRRLGSPDEEVRLEVVRQLSEKADPKTIELLGIAISDSSEKVAKVAIEAMAKIRTPEVLDLLSAAVRRLLIERTMSSAISRGD